MTRTTIEDLQRAADVLWDKDEPGCTKVAMRLREIIAGRLELVNRMPVPTGGFR